MNSEKVWIGRCGKGWRTNPKPLLCTNLAIDNEKPRNRKILGLFAQTRAMCVIPANSDLRFFLSVQIQSDVPLIFLLCLNPIKEIRCCPSPVFFRWRKVQIGEFVFVAEIHKSLGEKNGVPQFVGLKNIIPLRRSLEGK